MTLDSNTVSDTCSAGGDYGSGRSDFGSLGFADGNIAPVPGDVPGPGTVPLLCVGLLALISYAWKSRKRVARSSSLT